MMEGDLGKSFWVRIIDTAVDCRYFDSVRPQDARNSYAGSQERIALN